MSAFTILEQAGENYIIGTDKGNIGIISSQVMDDLDLHPSKDIEVTQIQKGRPVYRVAYMPPMPISAFTEYMSPSSTVTIETEDILVNKRYGNAKRQLVAGYSARKRMWVFWIDDMR